jgi:nicotinamide-nucleotide amidase
MNVEILAVGSELLSPFYWDTDSLYLTQRLNDLGFDVSRKTVIGDDRGEIGEAVRSAVGRADYLFITGGLGPTSDDLTREGCAGALGRRLVLHPEIVDRIEARFKRRGRPMPPANVKQAEILEGADILNNENGTAPGQWISAGTTTIVLLPGPPHELKPMFEESVWPRLASARRGYTARVILKTTGLTESEVETRVASLFPDRPDLRLTVLASPGQIDLHITAFSSDADKMARSAADGLSAALQARLGDFVYSTSGSDLESVVGRLLAGRHLTLAAAESCTGGLLAERLTRIPGSSTYFIEGFITYSNAAKQERLGVPADLIKAHGAVSAEVASAMAAGARHRARTDFGLGITGIAGPSGGTADKPVGLVFIACASGGGTEVQKSVFLGDRSAVRFQASQRALDMLRRTVGGISTFYERPATP